MELTARGCAHFCVQKVTVCLTSHVNLSAPAAVEKVVVAVREEMAALYSISDSIAMLDMLMSFATLVSNIGHERSLC